MQNVCVVVGEACYVSSPKCKDSRSQCPSVSESSIEGALEGATQEHRWLGVGSVGNVLIAESFWD